RQEAVAGMDGLRVGDLGSGDDARDVQVALGRRGWADADGIVGELEVRRIAIGLAVDDHAFDAEVLAGADDAQSDFASVRDQDALEHASILTSPERERGETAPLARARG